MSENDLFDINIVCKMLNTTSRALRFYEEKGIMLIILILMVITILCLVKYYRDNQSIKSFMAVGSSVQELSTSDECSYLKIILADK